MTVLEHQQVTYASFVASRIKKYGIQTCGPPLRLPLARHLVGLPAVPNDLLSIARVSEMRRALCDSARWFLLSADPSRDEIEQVAASLQRDPILGPWLCHHRLGRVASVDDSSVPARPFELITEINAHLAAITALPMLVAEIKNWSQAEQVCRSVSPSPNVVRSASELLTTGLHPAVIRYCLWRAYHGRLVRFSADPPDFTDDLARHHPASRASLVWQGLTSNTSRWPQGAMTPPNVELSIDWREVEKRLSELCGFEELEIYMHRSTGEVLGTAPEHAAFDEDIRVFFHYAGFFLNRALAMNQLSVSDAGRLFSRAGYDQLPSGQLIATQGPVAELVGETVLYPGEAANAAQDREVFQRVVFALLYFELSSSGASPFHRWARVSTPDFWGHVDLYLSENYGLSSADIDWEHR